MYAMVTAWNVGWLGAPIQHRSITTPLVILVLGCSPFERAGEHLSGPSALAAGQLGKLSHMSAKPCLPRSGVLTKLLHLPQLEDESLYRPKDCTTRTSRAERRMSSIFLWSADVMMAGICNIAGQAGDAQDQGADGRHAAVGCEPIREGAAHSGPPKPAGGSFSPLKS